MKRITIILIIIAAMVFASCGDNNSSETTAQTDLYTGRNEITLNNYETENPVVEMTVKDYGTIIIELYPDVAPNTVNNFISLIRKGFYDNNTIHRMIPGFVIQGGDPDGLGSGGPGYSIKGEFSQNGFNNALKHTQGVLSMARASNDYDSAGSQFFIMIGDASHLDGAYAAFGKVIDGYDVCEEISKIREYNSYTGKLTYNLTIEKMAVDLKGKSYPEPEIIK